MKNIGSSPIGGAFSNSKTDSVQKQSGALRPDIAAKIDLLSRHVPGMFYQFLLCPNGSYCCPYASQGVQDIFGVSPEQVMYDGAPVKELVHPDDMARVKASIIASARSLQIWRSEFRVNHPNGETIWVEGESTPERLDDGSILWHGYIRNVTDMKLTQSRLEQSEQRFRDLFQQSPVSILIHDAETGDILEANQATLDAYKVDSLEHLVQRQLWTTDEPHTFEQARDFIQRARDMGPQTFEWKSRKATGETFWEMVKLQRITLDGRDRILASCVDITQQKELAFHLDALRKRAEAQLKFPRLAEEMDEQELLQHALDIAEDLTGSKVSFIHFVDEDQEAIDLVAWSARTRNEYCTAVYDNHYPIQQAGIWADAIRLRKPVIVNDYPAHPHKAGMPEGHAHLQRFIAVPVFNEGKVVVLTGVGNKEQDYTDFDVETVQTITNAIWSIVQHKRAQQSLLASEKRLRILSQQVPGLVYEFQKFPDGRICFPSVSGHIRDILGREPEEVLEDATIVMNRVHPDDKERVAAAIEHSFQTLQLWDCEFRYEHPEKGTLWVWGISNPSAQPDGSVLWHGYIADMTERKAAEQERERLQAQLNQAQKMESIGRLAGGVAHDFNNMLSVILGNVQLALDRLGPHEPLRDELTEIQHAAQRSADLTRQLLAFARKQTVVPSVLDLNETVEGMLKIMRRLIGEDIDLVWRPGSHIGHVFIDPSQVDQILANLCVNARDAISGSGTITIETGKASLGESDCVRAAGWSPGEYVTMSVTDDGCGMDDLTISTMFEPFFTTKETGKGTGLGLATVYGAVTQNNGFIDVKSKPGHGTTFTIFLPSQMSSADATASVGTTQTRRTGNETILLVEDEPAISKMSKAMLEKMG